MRNRGDTIRTATERELRKVDPDVVMPMSGMDPNPADDGDDGDEDLSDDQEILSNADETN